MIQDMHLWNTGSFNTAMNLLILNEKRINVKTGSTLSQWRIFNLDCSGFSAAGISHSVL